MAMLSGTASKFVLDLLRSGKAFEPGGVKLFKSGYRATQGVSAPEEVVSEFQRLVKALEVEAIQRRINATRLLKSAGFKTNRVRDASGTVPWSAIRTSSPYIPRTVDQWTNLSNFDQAAVNRFLNDAEVLDKTADSLASIAKTKGGIKNASKEDVKGISRYRQGAARTRTDAAIVEAIYRLFGSNPS